MKGIVLAGGTGSRLWPSTKVVSKQLLPVYDKPMIYYSIATLMLAGIREILVITTPHDAPAFQKLLGNGTEFGMKFEYASQPKPEGLAQAFIIGEKFLGSESCLMILGDNIFHGAGLGSQLKSTMPSMGAHIFTYQVANPSDYGILQLDDDGYPKSIEEKPKHPQSNLAVTGLYFFDNRVSKIAHMIEPSDRNELEITSIIDFYLQRKELKVTHLSRGTAWLDTGNPNSLNDASNYVRIIQERTGQKIACLEEIALANSWINQTEFEKTVKKYGKSSYINSAQK